MIHARAEISPDARLATGVTVWQCATILGGTIIGPWTVIGSCVWIGRECRIGANCRLNHGVFVPHRTIIEDDVFIGPGAILTDDRYPVAGNKDYDAKPPIIRKGASIGAGAIILPGIEIGIGAMIAAGAIVTKDVPTGVVAFGAPRKVA